VTGFFTLALASDSCLPKGLAKIMKSGVGGDGRKSL